MRRIPINSIAGAEWSELQYNYVTSPERCDLSGSAAGADLSIIGGLARVDLQGEGPLSGGACCSLAGVWSPASDAGPSELQVDVRGALIKDEHARVVIVFDAAAKTDILEFPAGEAAEWKDTWTLRRTVPAPPPSVIPMNVAVFAHRESGGAVLVDIDSVDVVVGFSPRQEYPEANG